MTKNQIKKIIAEKDVKFIQMQFVNIHGQLHSIEIPIKKLDDVLEGNIMFDGSSIPGMTTITTSDLFLKPDLSTFLVLNFENSEFGLPARFLCEIYTKDNEHFVGDPRYTLKKTMEKLAKDGYTPYIGLEAEFFLLKQDDEGNTLREPGDDTGYFSASPLDTATIIKRHIVQVLDDHGFEAETLHKEVAEGQHEINFKYADAMRASDNVITFKWIVRNIAERYGYTATFMPKPFEGINGSGMHTNISLFKDGKNSFYNPDTKKGLSIEATRFITGIMNRSVEIAAIANPSVNSYKRLIPGFEAPNVVAWSDSNRSAMIRVPASRGLGTRTEVRNPDPTANPYLLISALLEAGYEGVKKKVQPEQPTYENLFKVGIRELKERGIQILPGTLGEALMIMNGSTWLKEVMGEHQHEQYITHKWKEWDAYRQIVHTWEFGKYVKY